jgi:endonuclease YncB( thermonuclease family)
MTPRLTKNFTSSKALASVLLAIVLPASNAAALDVSGTGVVTKVADGDTFTLSTETNEAWEDLRTSAQTSQQRSERDLRISDRFDPKNRSFVVRVGNIDTAESVHPDASKNTAAGDRASAYARNLLLGERVSFVCWDIGYYGRAICSIWNDDWEFGSHMIARGLSKYVTEFGEHPYWDEGYRKAAESAQSQMR